VELLSRKTDVVPQDAPLQGRIPSPLEVVGSSSWLDKSTVSESNWKDELPVEKESARGPQRSPTGSDPSVGFEIVLKRSSARPLRAEMSTKSTARKNALLAKAIAHPPLV